MIPKRFLGMIIAMLSLVSTEFVKKLGTHTSAAVMKTMLVSTSLGTSPGAKLKKVCY